MQSPEPGHERGQVLGNGWRFPVGEMDFAVHVIAVKLSVHSRFHLRGSAVEDDIISAARYLEV